MQLVPNDVVTIRKSSTEKRISVEVNVFDSVAKVDRGTYSKSWADAAELAEYVGNRTLDDVLRVTLADCVDVEKSEVKRGVLEAKVGKKFAMPEAKASTATEAVQA